MPGCVPERELDVDVVDEDVMDVVLEDGGFAAGKLDRSVYEVSVEVLRCNVSDDNGVSPSWVEGVLLNGREVAAREDIE